MPVEWWNSESVPPFRQLARAFIELIEQRQSLAPADLLHRAHVLLPSLYGAGLALPEKPEEAYEDEPDDTLIDVRSTDTEGYRERWRPIFRSLQAQLGERWDFYREVSDPYEASAEVVGSLADDL